MQSDDLTLLWNIDTAALRTRAITAQLTNSPRSRITWEFIFELAVNGVGIVLLGSYATDHIGDLQLALPAGALMAFLVAYTIARVRQLTMIRTLDPGAPLVQTRERMARIALARARLIATTLALGPLLWTMTLLLLSRAAFGKDVTQTFGFAYVLANFIVALIVLVAGVVLSRKFLAVSAPGTFARRVCDVLAGESLARARRDLDTIVAYAQSA
jgi:hypothetical protein